MILNCDMGERGTDHAGDRNLMSYIDLANLACGGHAGDADSVAFFRALAERQGVEISAHLSYPDRASFGRVSMDLHPHSLSASLEDQIALLPGVTTVKFHGALYNDSCSDPELAARLAEWLADHSVTTVLCPPGSAMEQAARSRRIGILAEAFIDRRYVSAQGSIPKLVPRSDPEACHFDLESARTQARELMRRGGVTCVTGEFRALKADTLCIHSDSELSLELAKALHAHRRGPS